MFIINNNKLKNLSGFPVLNAHISSIPLVLNHPYSTTVFQTFYSNKLPIAYTVEEYGKVIFDNPNYAIINLNTN